MRAIPISSVRFPKDYNFNRDGFTQSMLGAFLACPLRSLLQLNRWRLPGMSKALTFGDMAHFVLENFYSKYKGSVPPEKSVDAFLKLYEKKKTAPEYKEYFLTDEFSSSWAAARALLYEYLKFYGKDFKEKRFVEVEKVFDIKIPFRFRGKRDGGFLDKSGGLWIMEHKFYKDVNPATMVTDLALDFQTKAYVASYYLQYKKMPKGVLYNVVRKPQNKRQDGESALAYSDRLRKIIVEKPEYYFYRFEIRYTEAEIKEFITGLGIKVKLFSDFCNGKFPVFANEFSCNKPYACSYQGACSTRTLVGYEQRGELFLELKE